MPASSSGSSVPPPSSATVIADRYRLDRRINHGGMAEVWLGTDLQLGREVAVKLLRRELVSDPTVVERFRREARAVARLNHPNIVAVYDAVNDVIDGQERQAVIMELIPGRSLREVLDKQQRLTPETTIHIGSCVADALAAAHQQNLVHRDVKPGNILLTPDGLVKLTDFGIAKGPGDDLTDPAMMMGTMKYLSPEQVRGEPLDGRADLYSLGLVMYECLAGRVPFIGDSPSTTATARLARDPTDLNTLRANLPPDLVRIIRHLLAREPHQRPRSGTELKAQLARVSIRPPVRPPRSNTTPSRDTTPTGDPLMPRLPIVTPPGGEPSRSTPPHQRRSRDGRGSDSSANSTPRAGRTTPSGGYRSITGGRAAGPPIRPERTPTNTSRPQQRPNRRYEQRRAPSVIIVVGLLLAAVVVGGILWATMRDGDAEPFVPPSSSTATSTDPTVSTPPPPLAATLFDPDGDGTEKPTNVGLVLDGDPQTAWSTICYADRYIGGKALGVVVDLGVVGTGTLRVYVDSAPYQMQISTAADGPEPTGLSAFPTSLDKLVGSEPGYREVRLSTPARYVLVRFLELGRSDDCQRNPYRGRIGEISWSAD